MTLKKKPITTAPPLPHLPNAQFVNITFLVGVPNAPFVS